MMIRLHKNKKPCHRQQDPLPERRQILNLSMPVMMMMIRRATSDVRTLHPRVISVTPKSSDE